MGDARDYFPKKPKPSLSELSAAAERCHGCDLYERATQTVFGEGAHGATLMLVGEQPGDQEDQKGHPFVGPAGALLDRALAEAGISREQTYVTNAVKHFKWTPAPRGKRRIHSKPNQQEIRACRPWLEEEVRAVGPRVLVVMGATAAQSLLGSAFRVSRERGKVLRHTEWAPAVVATVHPSAVLRSRDDEDRRQQLALLVSDLRVALEAAREGEAAL